MRNSLFQTSHLKVNVSDHKMSLLERGAVSGAPSLAGVRFSLSLPGYFWTSLGLTGGRLEILEKI
jgi:hypothetical protein